MYLPLFAGIEHLESVEVLRARELERQRLTEFVISSQDIICKMQLAKISRKLSNESVQGAIEAGNKDADFARKFPTLDVGAPR
jgi:hypothetical protein